MIRCSRRPPIPAPSPPPAAANPLPTCASRCDSTTSAPAVGTWSGPRYRMTYRILGQGPALIWLPGIASTYRTYALVLNRLAERFQTIQYEYPGDREDDGARLGRITHDHLVDDLVRPDRPPGLGRALPGGHLVRIDDRAEGRSTASRERFPRTVVQGAFARRRFTRGGASGAVPGPAGSRNRGAAAAAADGPRLQQQDGLPQDHRGPLAFLSRGERADANQGAGPSHLVGCPARPAAQPAHESTRKSCWFRDGKTGSCRIAISRS